MTTGSVAGKSPVSSVKCVVFSVKCAVCSVQCAVCSVQSKVSSVQCEVCIVDGGLQSMTWPWQHTQGALWCHTGSNQHCCPILGIN